MDGRFEYSPERVDITIPRTATRADGTAVTVGADRVLRHAGKVVLSSQDVSHAEDEINVVWHGGGHLDIQALSVRIVGSLTAHGCRLTVRCMDLVLEATGGDPLRIDLSGSAGEHGADGVAADGGLLADEGDAALARFDADPLAALSCWRGARVKLLPPPNRVPTQEAYDAFVEQMRPALEGRQALLDAAQSPARQAWLDSAGREPAALDWGFSPSPVDPATWLDGPTLAAFETYAAAARVDFHPLADSVSLARDAFGRCRRPGEAAPPPGHPRGPQAGQHGGALVWVAQRLDFGGVQLIIDVQGGCGGRGGRGADGSRGLDGPTADEPTEDGKHFQMFNSRGKPGGNGGAAGAGAAGAAGGNGGTIVVCFEEAVNREGLGGRAPLVPLTHGGAGGDGGVGGAGGPGGDGGDAQPELFHTFGAYGFPPDHYGLRWLGAGGAAGRGGDAGGGGAGGPAGLPGQWIWAEEGLRQATAISGTVGMGGLDGAPGQPGHPGRPGKGAHINEGPLPGMPLRPEGRHAPDGACAEPGWTLPAPVPGTRSASVSTNPPSVLERPTEELDEGFAQMLLEQLRLRHMAIGERQQMIPAEPTVVLLLRSLRWLQRTAPSPTQRQQASSQAIALIQGGDWRGMPRRFVEDFATLEGRASHFGSALLQYEQLEAEARESLVAAAQARDHAWQLESRLAQLEQYTERAQAQLSEISTGLAAARLAVLHAHDAVREAQRSVDLGALEAAIIARGGRAEMLFKGGVSLRNVASLMSQVAFTNLGSEPLASDALPPPREHGATGLLPPSAALNFTLDEVELLNTPDAHTPLVIRTLHQLAAGPQGLADAYRTLGDGSMELNSAVASRLQMAPQALDALLSAAADRIEADEGFKLKQGLGRIAASAAARAVAVDAYNQRIGMVAALRVRVAQLKQLRTEAVAQRALADAAGVTRLAGQVAALSALARDACLNLAVRASRTLLLNTLHAELDPFGNAMRRAPDGSAHALKAGFAAFFDELDRQSGVPEAKAFSPAEWRFPDPTLVEAFCKGESVTVQLLLPIDGETGHPLVGLREVRVSHARLRLEGLDLGVDEVTLEFLLQHEGTSSFQRCDGQHLTLLHPPLTARHAQRLRRDGAELAHAGDDGLREDGRLSGDARAWVSPYTAWTLRLSERSKTLADVRPSPDAALVLVIEGVYREPAGAMAPTSAAV